MAVRRNIKTGYGFSQGLINTSPQPIVSKRTPKTSDKAEIGTIWLYQNSTGTDDVFILSSIVSNSSNWVASGGGSGSFDSLDVTNAATIGTALTLSAGDLTVGALGAGTVRSSAAGVFSVLADGADGTVLIGTTGGAAAWGTLTAGAGINIAEAAGTITISNPGVTGTTMTASDANVVSPDGTGDTDVIGYDANITTDGATANTLKIRLADNISSVGSITAANDLTMTTGTLTVTSDDNSAQAIYLHANAGVNETIDIASTLGTGGGAVYLHADAGGITLETGNGLADSLTIDTTAAGGGIDIDVGAQGVNLAVSNGPVAVTSGTGNITIGADVTDHDITIGDNSGVNAMSLVSGTGHAAVTSSGNITLDAAGVLELNSSAGIIGIGNDAVAQNINIGTGAAQRVLTLGNTSAASQVIVDCGTAGISVGASATAHTSTFGSTNTTSATTIQSGTGALTATAGGIFDVNAAGAITIDSSASTIGIGTDAVAQNINIGTGAAARVITAGNVTGASSVILNVGTGNLDLGVSATSHTTRLGSTSGTSATTVQAGTGAMTFSAGGIFDVNAIGAVTLDGTTHTVTSSADSAQAIYLHSNGGVTETIEVVNTQGTDAASIALTSTAGGITATADTATGIKLDATGSVDIVADTGTSAAAAVTLNKRVGIFTATGLVTASGATQRYTITNSECSVTSGLMVTVSNKSAGNDCKITMEACTPGAGSFTVDTINNGTQALDNDCIISWIILN